MPRVSGAVTPALRSLDADFLIGAARGRPTCTPLFTSRRSSRPRPSESVNRHLHDILPDRPAEAQDRGHCTDTERPSTRIAKTNCVDRRSSCPLSSHGGLSIGMWCHSRASRTGRRARALVTRNPSLNQSRGDCVVLLLSEARGEVGDTIFLVWGCQLHATTFTNLLGNVSEWESVETNHRNFDKRNDKHACRDS